MTRPISLLDLDWLGERIRDLDLQDELYNATAQLVLAAEALRTMAVVPYTDQGNAVMAALEAALRPFLDRERDDRG